MKVLAVVKRWFLTLPQIVLLLMMILPYLVNFLANVTAAALALPNFGMLSVHGKPLITEADLENPLWLTRRNGYWYGFDWWWRSQSDFQNVNQRLTKTDDFI